MFCLIKEEAQKLKQAIINGEISPDTLSRMSSREVENALSKIISPENAKQVNLLYEKKLLLKNQEKAVTNLFRDVLNDKGLSIKDREMISEKIKAEVARKKGLIFDPKEGAKFLDEVASDIYSRKYKQDISLEEAETITKLSQKQAQLKNNYNAETEKWSSPKAKLEYGSSKVAVDKYVESLKNPDRKMTEIINDYIAEKGAEWEDNKPMAIKNILGDIAKQITDNTVAVVASIDNSFVGRQGLNTLMTHPTVWFDMFKKSFSDLGKQLIAESSTPSEKLYKRIINSGDDAVTDALKAEIYSNPNYINGNYVKAGILPKNEEAFPTTLPEKIPVLGRAFKASEVAFSNSAMRARTKTFDLLYDMAKEVGEDLNDKKQIESIGTIVNSITARGKWGKTGEGALVKTIMWAPKMLKANLDVLTAHVGQDITPFARKQAITNLVKITLTTSGIMAIANAINPGSVELDPRSSNFGNVAGIDVTGGKKSIITLLARALTLKSKSTVTGKVTPLNSGEYGAKTLLDVGVDFMANKTTPAGRIALDTYLKGTNIKGEKPTVKSEALALLPITLQNFINMGTDATAKDLIGNLLDIVGLNYSPSRDAQDKNIQTLNDKDLTKKLYDIANRTDTKLMLTDWNNIKPTSKQLSQFKARVGDKFDEAKTKYTEELNNKIKQTLDKNEFINLSDNDKIKVINQLDSTVQEKIFKEYHFKYKPQKSGKTNKEIKRLTK